MLIDTIPHREMFSWCNFHSAAYDSFDAKQKVRHCYGAARDRGSSAAEHCQPDAQPAQQSVPGGFSGHSSGAAGAGPSGPAPFCSLSFLSILGKICQSQEIENKPDRKVTGESAFGGVV